jgi:hypothetical protein
VEALAETFGFFAKGKEKFLVPFEVFFSTQTVKFIEVIMHACHG